MNKITPSDRKIIIALIVLAVACIYQYVEIHSLSQKVTLLSTNVTTLQAQSASTTAQLQASIQDTRNTLTTGLSQEAQNVGNITNQLQQQVGSVTGTLTTLQKLSKTDPQLLAKYSKVFFLNENYAPERLSAVPDSYKYANSKDVSIQSDVLPHLQSLIDDARNNAINIFVFSGYRSFAEQKALKNEYQMTYGAGTANSFSADQGYSEHQLGTAVDFITPDTKGVLDGFDKTSAYPWLLANAYRYGFILSYPPDNSYYVFEPWHWRFVGVKLATDLHNQAKNFYDLDQRAIDAYLVNFFD